MSSDDRNDFHLFIQENGTWIITFLGICGACCSGLTIYFLKSRCSHIKLCWGAIECIREPLPADMVQIEVPRNAIPLNNIEIIRNT